MFLVDGTLIEILTARISNINFLNDRKYSYLNVFLQQIY